VAGNCLAAAREKDVGSYPGGAKGGARVKVRRGMVGTFYKQATLGGVKLREDGRFPKVEFLWVR